MGENKSKVVKRVIGGSLLVVAGITGYYQYQYRNLQSDTKVPVVVATKQISISQSLSADNTKIELRDKNSLPKGYIQDINKVTGAVAVNTLYENEDIIMDRIVSADEYKKMNLKLVSIKGTDQKKDTFVGYDVKPFDVVDVLYFDKNGVYEGKPYIEGQVIYDLKSADGVSYANRADGYKASYALVWVNPDKAEDINQKQEEGGYFKFQLHRTSSSDNK